MALSAKTGNFAQPTATNASFAVTGVGFTPKAIILYASNQITAGISTSWAEFYGMATSTSNRVGISNFQTTATNTGSRAHDSTKCFVAVNAAGTTIVAADLVSFDSDGFTLNFSTVDAIARIVGYTALGGSDLTNAFIKAFLPAASNTAQGFTGVGFKPDAMILMSAQVGAATQTDTNAMGLSMGFGKDSTHRGALEAQPNIATESVQKASKIIEKSSSGGAITMEADLTSMDADGFTITFGVSSSVKECFALCLKGGQYQVGSFSQATSTGNQATTGVGFTPSALLLMSTNLATSASISTVASRLSFGSGTSSSARASIWAGGGNAGIQNNETETTKIISMITEGAVPATNATADLVSLDSDGFTVNWTTADATVREILYFAVGSNAVVASATASTLLMMGV